MADVRLDLVLDGDTLLYDGGSELVYVEHAKKLNAVIIDPTPPTAGQALVAIDATHAEWGAAAGNVSGPGTSVADHVAVFADTSGNLLDDSGILVTDIVLTGDSRLSNARVPTPHKTTHQDGGADEIVVTGLAGLLADAQTPLAHAAAHQHGGADEIAVAIAANNAIPKAGGSGKLDIGWLPLGTSASDVTVGNDGRLSNARTPTAHAASHQDGGTDEISVAGLSGLLVTPQTPAAHATAHELGGGDQLSVAGLSGELADPQPPKTHASTHANGGADEISVAGLSGVLADAQLAGSLATSGAAVSVVGAAPPSVDQVLRATSATTATWQTMASGGDVVGAASSVNNEVAAFSSTTGKVLKNTSILYTNLILEGDSRLTNARTPSTHATSHQHAGGDEIATATAANNAIPKANGTAKLDIGWIPTGSSGTTVAIGNDARLSDSRTPTSHASSHQAAGGDQISIAGLSGRGASNQTADQIATSGTAVSISTTAPSANQFLRATSTTAASWQTVAFGDVTGPGSSVSGNLPSFNGTGGKTLQDSGVALADVVLTADSRLTNSRAPTAHATNHQHGGSDEIATTTAGANAIPKATAGGQLGIGWIPTGTSSSTVCIGNDARLTDTRVAHSIATSGTAVSISTTAPTTGQVLQATSATAAAWQTLSPGGTAGGMLGGTYPNPDVVALKSATTTVAISAATAPTANQALVATSGTAAAWKNIMQAILASPTAISSNVTLAVNTFNLVDTSGGARTLTLPTTHAAGDFIWVQQSRWGNPINITVPASHLVNDIANGGTTIRVKEVEYNASGGTLPQALFYSTDTTHWVVLIGGMTSTA